MLILIGVVEFEWKNLNICVLVVLLIILLFLKFFNYCGIFLNKIFLWLLLLRDFIFLIM